MTLKNTTVVVTGASDGIGREVTLKLAKEGSRTALIARDEKRLNDVKKETQNLGGSPFSENRCD